MKSPKYVRRTILNTAVGMVGLMQQQDKIKKIKEEKRKVMLMLAEEVKTTNNLINNFYELIPKAKLHKPKQKIITPKVKQHKQIEIKLPTPSKLDSLQQELFDLKSRLDKI